MDSSDEKLLCVIAVGYGAERGAAQSLSAGCAVLREATCPHGSEAGGRCHDGPDCHEPAEVFITAEDNEAVITAKKGFLTGLDLGIVQYSFEAASGHACRIQMK